MSLGKGPITMKSQRLRLSLLEMSPLSQILVLMCSLGADGNVTAISICHVLGLDFADPVLVGVVVVDSGTLERLI